MGIRGAAILGASGFLGSHLVRGFEARGARVVPILRVVDARSPVEAVPLADAVDGSAPAERIRGLDVMVHAASLRTTASPFAMRAAELELLERAMRLASSARVRRFLLVSCAVVYGFPSRLPVTEDHPFAPRTAHAAVRLEVEMRARRLARELGLELAIVRPARMYGPGDRSGLLEGLASMIRSGTYRVVGEGDNVLHHIHVDDAVEGVWLAATCAEAAGEHFLLAGPETTTLAALSELVARAIGRSLPRQRVPSGFARALATVVDVAASRGLAFVGSEPPRYHAKLDELTLPQWFDVTKARRRLAFVPRVVYEEGVARTLQGEWPALARAGAGS